MIDLEEVQSTVLRRSDAEALDVHLLSCCCRDHLRGLLAAAASAVTDAATGERRRAAGSHQAVNVAVSAHGVRLAGVRSRTHDALPGPFVRGMADAADRLHDHGPSAPRRWAEPFREADPPIHVVVLRWDDAPLGALERHVLGDGPVCADVAASPRRWRWQGRSLPGRREPFGFVDGITDPVVEGGPRPMVPGDGVWDAEAGAWRAVQPGELVLGHVDESGAVAGHPDAAHLERDGSYLVLRKLEQDVEGFHRSCAAWAAELGATPEHVEAQLVGRHHDGRPVGAEHLGPHGNDFLFAGDGAARSSMPPSCHVRRANPRDGIAAAEAIVPRHLLFRRSIPYAEPAEHGGTTQGLLFLACCADPRRQFEFVQAQWLEDGNRFGLGAERDPLVGTRTATDDCAPAPGADAADVVSVGHDGRRRRAALPAFVTTRGGEYLLLASRSALALLADPRGR